MKKLAEKVENIGFPEKLRIELHETPLDFGRLDNILFGRDASHSFLVLKDEKDKILSEIHGTSYHRPLKKLGHGGQSLYNIFNILASEMRVRPLFNRVAKWTGMDAKISRLRVHASEGKLRSDPADVVVPVKIGSYEEIMPLWLSCLEAGRLINQNDLPYKGVTLTQKTKNCHAVTSAMLRRINAVPENITMTYAVPGFAHMLSKILPQLKEITADRHRGKSRSELQENYKAFLHALNDSVTDSGSPAKTPQRPPQSRATPHRIK